LLPSCNGRWQNHKTRGGFSHNPLTEILRSGALRLIEQAVEAELTTLLAADADDKTEDGRSRVVHHGHRAEREVMAGIGPVPVKMPRGRDRAAEAEKVRFHVLHPAALSAQGEVGRRTAAVALSQGHFQLRFPRRVGRAPGAECSGALVGHHLAAQGRVVGRI